MAEIRTEGVTKRFGDVVALNEVTLTIPDGAFTSVFGPPGSGKSVLLRCLLGLDPVDEGRILIGGQDVTGKAPDARNLAMVFQNLALFPHLSARDNVLFPMRRRPVPQAEADARLDRIAAVLGIAHVLHKRPGALSGGERSRVAIARALIRDASAWMMDEPIAALDARLRDDARVELKRLQVAEGRTFVYVTHDCDEAMAVADRMVILDGGRVVQEDAPDAIYARPARLSVARLVGSPRVNVLKGEVRGGVLATGFGALALPIARDGEVAVVIRPESLLLGAPDALPLAATVADVEPLGGFTIVGVEAGGSRLRAVVEGRSPARLGDRVGIAVDPAGLHLYDTAGAWLAPVSA